MSDFSGQHAQPIEGQILNRLYRQIKQASEASGRAAGKQARRCRIVETMPGTLDGPRLRLKNATDNRIIRTLWPGLMLPLRKRQTGCIAGQ